MYLLYMPFCLLSNSCSQREMCRSDFYRLNVIPVVCVPPPALRALSLFSLALFPLFLFIFSSLPFSFVPRTFKAPRARAVSFPIPWAWCIRGAHKEENHVVESHTPQYNYYTLHKIVATVITTHHSTTTTHESTTIALPQRTSLLPHYHDTLERYYGTLQHYHHIPAVAPVTITTFPERSSPYSWHTWAAVVKCPKSPFTCGERVNMQKQSCRCVTVVNNAIHCYWYISMLNWYVLIVAFLYLCMVIAVSIA